MNHIVSNLPFGKQIELEQPEQFFTELLQEFSRLLRKGGNMVLLTTHAEMISHSASALGMSIISQTEISLFGLNPQILVIKK